MSTSKHPLKTVATAPAYVSAIVNIKHKARAWSITSHAFDEQYSHTDGEIHAHLSYGSYSELEKMWHVEFYLWSEYFPEEPFPFPFPCIGRPTFVTAEVIDMTASTANEPRFPFPPVYAPSPPLCEGSAKPALRMTTPPARAENAFTIKGFASAPVFKIRGTAPKDFVSPVVKERDANVGRAWNNRSIRTPRGEKYGGENFAGQKFAGEKRRVSLMDRMGPVADGRIAGEVHQRKRGAVQAARRQMKISRRTGGRK